MIDLLKDSSMVGLMGVVVSFAAVGLALAYALRPTERLLALMRPVTLAALFGGLSSFALGVASTLQGLSATPFAIAGWQRVASGLAASVVALFFAFGCLTIAWLLVALGLRRVDAS